MKYFLCISLILHLRGGVAAKPHQRFIPTLSPGKSDPSMVLLVPSVHGYYLPTGTVGPLVPSTEGATIKS